MRGLLVDILRPRSDCTNAGVTSKANQCVLVGDGIAGVFEPSADAPALRLVVRWKGTPREYMHAEPIDQPAGVVGPMAGGNFIYSCDSRFRDVCPYPIPVHDRFETADDYAALSR